jgi:hypothetical protein
VVLPFVVLLPLATLLLVLGPEEVTSARSLSAGFAGLTTALTLSAKVAV